MSVFQNSNIVFRCPLSLKQRLKALADEREEHLSSFIRSACVEALHQEYPSILSRTNSITELTSQKGKGLE